MATTRAGSSGPAAPMTWSSVWPLSNSMAKNGQAVLLAHVVDGDQVFMPKTRERLRLGHESAADVGVVGPVQRAAP
ncbi:MAG: hypothetical protein U0531_08185 [Dehalococcoidia bacterium]